MSDLSIPTSAPASAVRQWARENNLPIGTRGVIAPAIITAYNRVHPVKHTPGKFKPQRKVEVVVNGRKRERVFNDRLVRSTLIAAGFEVGVRGPLRAGAFQQALDLIKG